MMIVFEPISFCPMCDGIDNYDCDCGNCGKTLGRVCAECLTLVRKGQCECESPLWPIPCDLCGKAVFPGECPHVSEEDFRFFSDQKSGPEDTIEF